MTPRQDRMLLLVASVLSLTLATQTDVLLHGNRALVIALPGLLITAVGVGLAASLTAAAS